MVADWQSTQSVGARVKVNEGTNSVDGMIIEEVLPCLL